MSGSELRTLQWRIQGMKEMRSPLTSLSIADRLTFRIFRTLMYADGPNLHQLVFDGTTHSARIMANQYHVLRQMLPNTTTHNYGRRSRRHNCTLNIKSETNCCQNFITRLLYKDMYWLTQLYAISTTFYFLFYVTYCTSYVLTTSFIHMIMIIAKLLATLTIRYAKVFSSSYDMRTFNLHSKADR